MRITRKVHGILDYVHGVLLAASPWLFGFAHEPFAAHLALTFGGIVIFYSLLTNYEFGLVGLLPFGGHRLFDLLMAIMVGGSLWHFDMHGRAGIVFAAFGAVSAVVTFLTRRPAERGTIAR